MDDGCLYRGAAPSKDIDDIRKRKGALDWYENPEGILEYTNKVFLPTIKTKLQSLINDLYGQLKDLPGDIDAYGRDVWKKTDLLGGFSEKSLKVEAIEYIQILELLVKDGFNEKIIDKFVDYNNKNKRKHFGRFDYDEFINLLKEPNGRAKFGKILLDIGKSHYNDFEKMKKDALSRKKK